MENESRCVATKHILRRCIPVVVPIIFAFAQIHSAKGYEPSYRTIHWEQGQPPKYAYSAISGFCVLSRISGNFQGAGELVRVYLENNEWKISGTSGQEGINGNATCVNWWAFNPAKLKGHNDIHQNVNIGQAAAEMAAPADNSVLIFHPPEPPCGNQRTAVNGPDIPIFITGMSGQFDGGGEYVRVTQADPPQIHPGNATSYVIAANCARGSGQPIRAYAHTFTMKREGASAAQGPWVWIGPNGTSQSPSQAGEYSVSSAGAGAPSSLVLPNIKKAFCFLTHIGGKFRGGGEWVELGLSLQQDGEHWVLNAGHLDGGAPDGTFARAQCLSFQD